MEKCSLFRQNTEVWLRNIVVMILACTGIKPSFSGKFLESLPRRTKLSRDLAVIKENRAERVGVQRLFDFDDSSVAKEGLGRVGSNTPYHSVARRILFIPGWYACSLASSTESLFSTLHLYFSALPTTLAAARTAPLDNSLPGWLPTRPALFNDFLVHWTQ